MVKIATIYTKRALYKDWLQSLQEEPNLLDDAKELVADCYEHSTFHSSHNDSRHHKQMALFIRNYCEEVIGNKEEENFYLEQMKTLFLGVYEENTKLCVEA